MQQTRLFNLLSNFGDKFTLFFTNPWRRLSLLIIIFFFGFLGVTGVITTAGQLALWDITVSVVLLLFTELISIFVYSRKVKKSIWINVLNSFKLGMAYSLYLQALQLNT